MALKPHSMLTTPALLALVACTAGGDVVPDQNDGGSATVGSGGAGVVPNAGASNIGGDAAVAGSTANGGSIGNGGIGTGGSLGGGTGVGGSGSAGAAMADPYEAVKVFDGWRIDMECTADGDNGPISPNCANGDICNMKDDVSGRTSFTINKKVGGDPNTLYKFRVRIRGVLEPKAFDPAQCPPLFEGPEIPIRPCKCVDPECLPIESGFNWMQLNISAPKQRYWINNSKDAISHRVEVVDGQFDMEVRGQADIDYFFDNLNTGQIRNCQNKVAPDLPFYEGNFFIFDIVPGSVTTTPAI